MAWGRKKSKDSTPPDAIGAIVGSGATYRVSSYADATRLALQRQYWQDKAFAMYDTEGHLFYAANYVGSALARVKLVAARRAKSDAQNQHPEIIESGPLADAVANIQSPRGGQRGLMRQVGRNVFLTGEVWLIGAARTLPNGSVAQSWDAVSINELRTNTNTTKFLRYRLPGVGGEELPEGALTIRMWKEHPQYSELADSGTRSCLELLEKIVTLNRAEKAIARSRLAGSGILVVPQELVPAAWQNQAQNPDAMDSNPMWTALAESMTAPLSDEDHPSAVVPLVLIGQGDSAKNLKYEPMSRSFDTDAANKSMEVAIEQVANTLELPKEVLLGTGEVTHWTAWAIREDTFQAHIQPLAELVCDALTSTYLKRVFANMSPEQRKAVLDSAGVDDPDDVMIWYDASQLIIRPDKAESAQALHDRFAISDKALRRENGYAEEDAPDEEEYARRVGIKMADAGMALDGEPTPPPAPGGGAGPGRPPGPSTVNGPRGQSPQGKNAAPPKQPAERRVKPGTPK